MFGQCYKAKKLSEQNIHMKPLHQKARQSLYDLMHDAVARSWGDFYTVASFEYKLLFPRDLAGIGKQISHDIEGKPKSGREFRKLKKANRDFEFYRAKSDLTGQVIRGARFFEFVEAKHPFAYPKFSENGVPYCVDHAIEAGQSLFFIFDGVRIIATEPYKPRALTDFWLAGQAILKMTKDIYRDEHVRAAAHDLITQEFGENFYTRSIKDGLESAPKDLVEVCLTRPNPFRLVVNRHRDPH